MSIFWSMSLSKHQYIYYFHQLLAVSEFWALLEKGSVKVDEYSKTKDVLNEDLRTPELLLLSKEMLLDSHGKKITQ